jgi:signal transduction histidine kinase
MSCESTEPQWAAYDLPLTEQSRDDSAAKATLAGESDELILLQNGVWFCSLRWFVIAALAVFSLVSWVQSQWVQLSGIRLEAGWPLAVAAILSVFNVTHLALARRAAQSPRRALLAWRGLWLQIFLDLAVLTVVIHYLGSLASLAAFMYLFHIVLACIFLPYRQSLVVTLSAMTMYFACLALEYTGLISARSVLTTAIVPDGSLPFPVLGWCFGTVSFTSVTVWYLASRLANALRKREEELAATNRRLEAATEERAGYMLRTTHQLKAPFAAIHANTQLLLGGYCGELPAVAVTIVEQIAARCEMLSRGIKSMLQLANLRSHAQGPLQPAPLDLAALIQVCVSALKSQAAKRGIAIEENLAPATVHVVPDHASMIIENILLNAVNYSRNGQEIQVTLTAKPDGGAVVAVRDHGIGIPRAALPRIFDDYFRTTEAAKHNHASTGLGLAIVRQTALAGKIGVHVESAPGLGTLFSLDFAASRGEANTLDS